MKKPAARSQSVVATEFDRRAVRAEALARQFPAAAEPLRFASGLYRAQESVAAGLEAANATEPLTGRAEADAGRLLERAGPILRFAAEGGPDPLAEQARARIADGAGTARTRLLVYWARDLTASEDYLSRAILRPYVELLRALNRPPDRVHKNGRCPFCGGAPWVAVRREGSLTEGARRLLACALCGVEWPFGRILCPACLEQDPHRLPSFSAQTHPTVRIEACETCHRYVKSLDLSEDARPIPEVDDLASLSMDLWAREQGYERIEPGIAGI